MGYESLYARDNVNYTRSWIADNSPYMMFGVNVQYPLSKEFTVAAFVVNSYYHLARPNGLPSYGGRWVWRATSRLTLTQTLYAGPDQTETSLEFWRLYGNHILEWEGDEVLVAASFALILEPRALPVRLAIPEPLSWEVIWWFGGILPDLGLWRSGPSFTGIGMAGGQGQNSL